MPILFNELLVRLESPQRFLGFEDVVMCDGEDWPLSRALGLVTCWDRVSTFEAFKSVDAVPPGYRDKVETRLSTFDPGRPVFAVALRRATLRRVWPDLYEPTADLVALDGNTRLSVLSIRRARGIVDGPVRVYLEP